MININYEHLNHTEHLNPTIINIVNAKKKQLHVLTNDHGVDFPLDLNCALVALINVNCLRCFWLRDNQVSVVFLKFL